MTCLIVACFPFLFMFGWYCVDYKLHSICLQNTFDHIKSTGKRYRKISVLPTWAIQSKSIHITNLYFFLERVWIWTCDVCLVVFTFVCVQTYIYFHLCTCVFDGRSGFIDLQVVFVFSHRSLKAICICVGSLRVTHTDGKSEMWAGGGGGEPGENVMEELFL